MRQLDILRASPGYSSRRLDVATRACSFFATCHPGLEEVVAKELREAVPGIAAVQPGRAGVSFRYLMKDIFTGQSKVSFRLQQWLHK